MNGYGLLNPSPYMGMLRFADFQLVSASPELLVQVEKIRYGHVRLPEQDRVANEDEDNRLAEELIP